MMRFAKLFFILLLALTVTGCHLKSTSSVPDKQFVFIGKTFYIDICNIMNGDCIEITEEESGSGVLVGHNKKEKKSYILTVAHVCKDDVSVEHILEDAPPFYAGRISSKEVVLKDVEGDEFEGSIVATDELNDLCLIETEYMNVAPMRMSRQEPLKHEKLYNIAAPYGIWDIKNSLMFEGYFTGYNHIHQHMRDLPPDAPMKICEEGVDDFKTCVEWDIPMAMYTIPSAPGASGSPIYNEQGELVGIISKVISPGYNISMGPSFDAVREFLDENLH